MKQQLKTFLLIICIILNVWQIKAQSSFPLTPNGIMDTVYDNFGNKYSLKSLRIDTTTRVTPPFGKTTQLCSAG